MATTTTPQKSSTGSARGAGGGTSVNFKNNCIICLQTESPDKMLELLQKNPKNIGSFQPVVHYLTGIDPTWGKSHKECAAKKLPEMQNLPPLCAKCYDIAGDIYRLHYDLLENQLHIQSKTEKLRKVVANVRRIRSTTGNSDKNLFLMRLQNDGMSKMQVLQTHIFVDNFHGHITAEGDKKVKFPSFPPPNFFPLPKPTVAPIVLVHIPVQQLQQQQQNPPTSTAAPLSTISTSLPPRMPAIITTTGSSPLPLITCASAPNKTASQQAAPILIRRSMQSQSLPVVVPVRAAATPPQTSTIPVATASSQISKRVTTSITTSTAKSDIVMLPGSSATIKFENEMEDEDEEDAQETIDLESEVVHQEERREELIFADENDEPPPPNNDYEDTSDEDWQMDEEDSENTGNDSDGSENCDNEGRSRSRLPKKSINHQQPLQVNKSKGQHSLQIGPRPPSSAPVKILPKLAQPQLVIVSDRKPSPSTASNIVFTTACVNPPIPSTTATVPAKAVVAGSGRRKQVFLTKDRQVQQMLPQKSTPSGKVISESNCIKRSSYQRKLKDKHECDVCNVRIPRDQQTSHLRTHLAGEDGHFCPSCERVFMSRSRLLQHWQVRYCGNHLRYEGINVDDNIICTTCPSVPGHLPRKYTLLEFRKHVFHTHETDKNLAYIYECVFCHIKFRTDHGLDFHLNVHCHIERRYTPGHWDICPQGAKTRLIYDSKFRTHSTQLKCDVCQVNHVWHQLENHIVSHHGISSDHLLKCILCAFVSSKLETHLDHLADIHGNDKCDVTCHLCGTNFVNAEQLRVHIFQRHGIGVLNIMCKFCDKYFPDEKGLDSHRCMEQQMKNISGHLVCVQCPPEKQTGYTSMELLNKHITKCHSQNRYKCQRCFAGFPCCLSLREHEKTAHADNPIVCELCGNRNKYKFQLAYFKHMNKEHYGGRGGSTKCFRNKFWLSASVRKHQNATHLKNKKQGYVCSKCDKSFTNRWQLTHHQKTHSTEENVQAPRRRPQK